MTELVLGTAQFGAKYGIANTTGDLSDEQISLIVDAARTAGINTFDTSPHYGEAQERLGRIVPVDRHPEYVSKFRIGSSADKESLYGRTMRALGVDALQGMLFHRVEDLHDPQAMAYWSLLREAREAGAIGRIGASIYDSEDLTAALAVAPDLDLLQIPGNVLDRRLLDHPTIHELHDRGCEIHVRSAYLQGLLLMDPSSVPGGLAELRPALLSLRAAAAEADQMVIEVALGYLKHHPVVDAVVVGALSAEELNATVRAWENAQAIDVDFPDLPTHVLDPRAWPTESTR